MTVEARDACVLDGTVCALDHGAPLDFGGQAALWAAGEFHRDHDPGGGRQGLAVIGRAISSSARARTGQRHVSARLLAFCLRDLDP